MNGPVPRKRFTARFRGNVVSVIRARQDIDLLVAALEDLMRFVAGPCPSRRRRES